MSQSSTGALPSLEPAPRMSMVLWLVCIIASIGFAFDIYELLMLPLILRPAIVELSTAPSRRHAENSTGAGLMFYVPAVCGGVFGLLGGYLTDRLGRRRVLIVEHPRSTPSPPSSPGSARRCRCCWSCVRPRSSASASSSWRRSAWLAELFPDPDARERCSAARRRSLRRRAAGGDASTTLADPPRPPAARRSRPEFASSWSARDSSTHAAWRYTLMSGLIPAIPLIVIRPFLPESPVWQAEAARGHAASGPSFAELFSPALARTTIVTTIMVACGYAAAFGAIQQIPQIVPGLPEVKAELDKAALKTQAAIAAIKRTTEEAGREGGRRKKLAGAGKQEAATINQDRRRRDTKQEVGGLVGRVRAGDARDADRQPPLAARVFQIPGIIVMPLVFAYSPTKRYSITLHGRHVRRRAC